MCTMILALNINNIGLEHHSLAQESNYSIYNVNKCIIMKCDILIQRKICQLVIIILCGFITLLVLREQAMNKCKTIATLTRIERNCILIDRNGAQFEASHYLTRFKDDTEDCYQVSLSLFVANA